MKTIILRPNEASQSGEITLMRPLWRQPPDEYEFTNVSENVCLFYEEEVEYSDNPVPYLIPLNYPVGARLGVRETWARMPNWTDNHYFVYKSDYSVENTYIETPYKWQSPATMPSKAIRKHLVVLEDTVKRVQELTEFREFEISMTTWEERHKSYTIGTARLHFINHFNSCFARPRKLGDGYVCYPWDMDGFLFGIHKDKITVKGDGYYWIGNEKYSNNFKPLTIHPNAWFEFFTARIE